MITNNSVLYSLNIIIEIFKDVLYFPLWWYTRGLVEFIKKNIQFLTYQQKSLGLFIWIKNLFKPMYGQTDWQGRLVSFVFRIVMIFFRSLVMMLFILLSLIAIAIWILLPFYIAYQIIYQIYPNVNMLFMGNVQHSN